MQETREPLEEQPDVMRQSWDIPKMDQRPELDCRLEQGKPMMGTAEQLLDSSLVEEELKSLF